MVDVDEERYPTVEDDIVEEEDEEAERRPLLGSAARAAEHRLLQRRELVGLSFMALSALLFSLMSVLVKISGQDFPFLEIVFARSLIQFSCGVVACLALGVMPWGPPTLNKFWLIARGSAGATGLALYFYTIVNMPLGDGMTIFFTGPAFTAVLAWLCLGEPLTRLDIGATVACLAGVTLVSQPDGDSRFSILTGAGKTKATSVIAPLAALAGAIMSSVAYVLVRKIGSRAHFMVHVTYFGLMSSLLSGFALLITSSPTSTTTTSSLPAIPPTQWTPTQYLTMCSVGLSAFIAQCFLNAGLQRANAGPATLMRNLDIVFAFVFGLAFFGEVPRVTSVLGAALILGATATVALWKWYGSLRRRGEDTKREGGADEP
ncbi:uncharacterized protein EV422DRAFT_495087 [Fimicolochytrium jonesii]|uniref:uncharacterized protein n=1 Tax=Fimicolochytrium jonesii TaxID=1396493 RepID=UPI0022FE0AD0|nr:uncharacterized protein EV422DRAFT_495087 [Fimicolochytrium jonesii]KAI8822226.1 hypothetical protein EV422DRAFT_495087 [Fimicolochytrium jonesii]